MSKKDSAEVQIRTTGRIKKPKAVFDPSPAPRLQKSLPTLKPNVAVAVPAISSSSESVNRTRRRSRSMTPQLEDMQEICITCQKADIKRKSKGKICCTVCFKKVHLQCLENDFAHFDRLQQLYKCDRCRRCAICNNASADMSSNKVGKDLVTCCTCVKSYHLSCHMPSVPRSYLNARIWNCGNCSNSKSSVSTGTKRRSSSVTATNEISNATKRMSAAAADVLSLTDDDAVETQPQQQQPSVSAVTSDDESQVVAQIHIDEASSSTRTVDTNFENGAVVNSGASARVRTTSSSSSATSNTVTAAKTNGTVELDIDFKNLEIKKWSIQEVHHFIQQYFPKEAHVFLEQEIDGASLLLLRRSDIVKKMSLNLGPSLRLYGFILKLQTQRNDNQLGWNIGQ